MIIRTAKKQNRFSIVDNTGFNDPRLSYKAKGLLGYFLTKPDDWQIRMEDLLKHGKDGLDAIKAGMKELRLAGYASLETGRDKQGHLTGKEWVIHESPIAGKTLFRSTDSGLFRQSGNPDYRKTPIIGKIPPLLSTEDVINTEVLDNTDFVRTSDENQTFENQKNEKPPQMAPRPPKVLFSESHWMQNAQAFVTEIQQRFPAVPSEIDFAYYYQRCLDWSASKPAKSDDWVKIAAKFILDDDRRGELHTSTPKSHSHANNTSSSSRPTSPKPLINPGKVLERTERIIARYSRQDGA